MNSRHINPIRWALLAALAMFSAVGCQEAPSNDAANDSSIPATPETQAGLGIYNWEVQGNSNEAESTVVGRGAHQEALAELHIATDKAAPSIANVTTDRTDDGSLQLADDGTVSGSGSERLTALVLQLSNDTDQANQEPLASPGEGEEAVATAEQGLSVELKHHDRVIGFEGVIRSGSTWRGISRRHTMGGPCKDGETRTAYEVHPGKRSPNCYAEGWHSQDPYDCRLDIHYGVSAGGSASCEYIIYQWGWGY